MKRLVTDGSIQVLELLGTHNEFMDSIREIAVLDDRTGHHTSWWSDYRSHEDQKQSQFTITNLCISESHPIEHQRKNVKNVLVENLYDTKQEDESFDFLWAHNVFQKQINPIQSLRHWWNMMREDAMLCISVPLRTYIDDLNRWRTDSYPGELYNWNMLTLIQMLAISGFDCFDGHFKFKRGDEFLWASVYKGTQTPMDPYTTTWYDLAEKELLPPSLSKCVSQFGHAKIEKVIVEWLDHSLYDLGKESLPY